MGKLVIGNMLYPSGLSTSKKGARASEDKVKGLLAMGVKAAGSRLLLAALPVGLLERSKAWHRSERGPSRWLHKIAVERARN
jgi:hypothetical protein